MKMKFRIAAAAMAAVTAISASAFSASAANAREHQLGFVGSPQYVCASESNMMNHITMWKTSGEFRDGIYWSDRTDRMTSGPVFGIGFQYNNPSGVHQGTQITGESCLARKLAEQYFATKTFVCLTPNDRYFWAEIGDQYRIKYNNRYKDVFVYQLPSSSNGYKLKVVEVVNNRVRYDRQYTLGGAYLFNGNESWHIEYYTRPIKRGDANCDGVVFSNYSPEAPAGSDTDALNDIFQHGLPSTVDTYDGYFALTYAASLDGDWYITRDDVNIIRYNGAYRIMNGNYNYIDIM